MLVWFGLVCADMDSCGLGEDGAIALAKSLPSARTLLVLDIRGNDIGARKSEYRRWHLGCILPRVPAMIVAGRGERRAGAGGEAAREGARAPGQGAEQARSPHRLIMTAVSAKTINQSESISVPFWFSLLAFFLDSILPFFFR